MILSPDNVWTREEVIARPCPVPWEAGIYGWYFRTCPADVPTSGCYEVSGYKLLYVGISPKAPPKGRAKPSTQTLRDRVRYHYSGNAEGSTLRLTLGCLLSVELDIELRRVGSGKRMTFVAGEDTLSEWMAKNAFVVWELNKEPWIKEKEFLGSVSLPLNLDGVLTALICSI